MKKLFKLLFFAISLTLISCAGPKKQIAAKEIIEVSFHLNLLDREDDIYKVSVIPPSLTEKNNIFQFASTAPGTYQIMDIGRYVRSFKAFDNKGEELATEQISTNQFKLSSPQRIARIEYQIAETWDTVVERDNIYRMCGTSIEEDHTLINGQAVFGYFKGKQSNPVKIKVDYPDSWNIGTALPMTGDGFLLADSYDHVVDSPILLGSLTKASMDVEGTIVDIYTYSKTGLVKSNQILESMKNMLLSASAFVNGLPVKRYTFLFHFEDVTNGAWEHSYSSEYVYKEEQWGDLENAILEVAAHEFFHVVTPLNIHSEIVDRFNFITPIPSKHLWLYEGTTEWAAHMMLFRSGQKSLEDYFDTLNRKIKFNSRYYDPTVSLLDLALNSYTPEGQKQYGNIYMKGALVAGLLDIRLLELSNGSKGLVDVVNALAKEYGPNKPFEDATFFDEFVGSTYPEIKEFMDNYVLTSQALPIATYYEKIGVHYDSEKLIFSLIDDPTDNQQKLRNQWMKPLEIN